MTSRLLNILLVEDDDVDAMNVARAFSKSNIVSPVFRARNGTQALRMLESGEVPPQRRLVLLDLNLPQMNGIEVLRALRADPALNSVPVVVLTTSNDERDRLEAFQLNVAGYLLKPVAFPAFVELMAALNRYWALGEMPG